MQKSKQTILKTYYWRKKNLTLSQNSVFSFGDKHLKFFNFSFLSQGLYYLWVSPVAQMLKNPPSMWETWVWALGWEVPLEMGTAIHCGILSGLQKSTDRGAWQATVQGFARSWTWVSNFHTHTHTHTHTQTHKIIHVKTFYILVSNIMEWSVSKETSKSGD